jgi:SnoaL-like domain
MTTPTAVRPGAPQSAVAGTFLESLAARDFPGLAATLTDGAHLSALLPSGPAEWDGPEQIAAAFRRWFGGADRFQLVDAGVEQVGTRLHLGWRARVHGGRAGEQCCVVAQQAFADPGPDGRITRMVLLCSGFCPEAGEPAPRPQHDGVPGRGSR